MEELEEPGVVLHAETDFAGSPGFATVMDDGGGFIGPVGLQKGMASPGEQSAPTTTTRNIGGGNPRRETQGHSGKAGTMIVGAPVGLGEYIANVASPQNGSELQGLGCFPNNQAFGLAGAFFAQRIFKPFHHHQVRKLRLLMRMLETLENGVEGIHTAGKETKGTWRGAFLSFHQSVCGNGDFLHFFKPTRLNTHGFLELVVELLGDGSLDIEGLSCKGAGHLQRGEKRIGVGSEIGLRNTIKLKPNGMVAIHL